MKSVLPKTKWKDNDKIIERFCKIIESYSLSNVVWKNVILLVDEEIMPLINNMKKESYYDFSGDMYRVLLRYAAGDGKILGQVLTPKHIANLMIDLADLRSGDSIIDPACGTGIFLVNSMNRLISMAKSENEIEEIKSKKIYGIEISKEMFFLTLVNMLINGDGKTNIYVDDDNPDVENRGIFKFSKDDFIEQPKKVIMNPPYLSQDEMWKFILKSMTLASERAVIIIPTSILNGNCNYKREFLREHSLISVINVPNNIFQNKSSSGASVKTSIIVVDINKPNKNNILGTYLYDLKDDGFISSKKHGRYDGNNKWNLIKDSLINDFSLRIETTGISKIIHNISENNSWHFSQFNGIDIDDFKKINVYLFELLQSLIDKKTSDKIETEIFKSKLISELKITNIKISQIQAFPANNLLKIKNDIINALRIEKYDGIIGEISYISAANQNNGSRLDKTRSIYNETILSDCLTWNAQGDGGAGLAYYHPYKFILGGTSFVFDAFNGFDQSIERKIFLAFAMSLEKKNRYHGNSITKKEFMEGGLTISLPVKNNNLIDFDLIDSFMNNDIVKAIKKVINEN